MSGQALKGHLDMLLLAVLAEGPQHGYGAIDELRRRSGEVFDLPEGTVYPALHRLERAGYLESSWTEASGRRRKTYSITRKGRSALADQTGSWSSFSAAIDKVVGGAAWISAT